MKCGAWPASPAPAQRWEYVFPLCLALVIGALGSLPYLYAYWAAPAGEVFMGFVGRGTPGANGYFMLARQVQEGFHLAENLMTPEPLPRNYLNFEWWIVGKAAAWTGLSLEAIFHVDRVLSVVGFCLAIYFLAALAIPSVLHRRVAVSIICLGSGLSWVLVGINQFGFELPLNRDVFGIQVFGYLVNKPHFIRATMLSVLTYAFLVVGLRRNELRWFVLSGVAALLHSAIRPYHMPELYLIYAILPALFAWRNHSWSVKTLIPFVVAGAVHLPAVFYYLLYAYLGSLGEVTGWERVPGYLIQHILWLTWPFLVFVLTLPYFLRLKGQREDVVVLTTWIIVAWLICQMYPYWGAGQETAFYAYQVAPVILVFSGPVVWCSAYLRRTRLYQKHWTPAWRVALAVSMVLVTLPSSAYVYASMFTSLKSDHPDWTYYLPESVHDALYWIADEVPPNTVILASFDTSQFIPRISQHKVVTGHDVLTANYDEKNWIVERFFGQAGDSDFKWHIVRRFDVAYVVAGPLERRLGAARLDEIPWLDAVHTLDDVTIYKVQSAATRRMGN